MKSVLILASLGVLSLLVLSCGVERKPNPPPPVPVPANEPLLRPDPAIILIDDVLPKGSEAWDGTRVLPQEERRELIRKGKLPQGNPSDEVVEYTLYSRSGPRKHYKVPKPAPVVKDID